MTNVDQHVYLSPHFDDAALSCGGAIHQQAQAGSAVLVITICAASPQPGEPLSPYTEAMHQRWGNPTDMVATRRAEDEASLRILGAEFRRLHLADCIYRGQPQAGEWYYTSDAAIFGQIHPAEVELAAEISQVIAELIVQADEAVIYAPLAVGHHVDHQLTRTAAWQLYRQGYRVAFYEDYPYVDPEVVVLREERPYTLEATLAAWPEVSLQPRLRFLSEADLMAKIESIRAYSSQVPMLFDDELKMARLVRDYALQVGQGRPAERIWIPE